MEKNKSIDLLRRIVASWNEDEVGQVDNSLIDEALDLIAEKAPYKITFSDPLKRPEVLDNQTEGEVAEALVHYKINYREAVVSVDGAVVQVFEKGPIFERGLVTTGWYACVEKGPLAHLATLTERPKRRTEIGEGSR